MVCLGATLFAQNITVTDAIGQSPTAFLKNNLLSGGGVYIFNVKHQNSASNISMPNIGTFDANGYYGLGMANGIIMTTNNIEAAVGPNNSGSCTMSLQPYYSDKTIEPLASGNVTGCSALDFDFVCLNGSVQFNYCFGSEEYMEFCCSTVNDLFVFLLTGPDPETGDEVTRNIAMIPGSVSEENPNGIAVAVNSVNRGDYTGTGGTGCYREYSDYYIDNEIKNDDGSDPEGVQYDGFTDKLVARANIVPCAIYHMHIGICNVGDNAWDSGVFIEGGSFYAPSDETGLSRVTVDTVKGHCPFNVTIDLSQAAFESGEVQFSYGGTAVYGVDYAAFDQDGYRLDSTTFTLSGEPRTFSLYALNDADLSENKTIEVYLHTSFCPEVPQLIVEDTQRFVLIRGGDVKLRDTTLSCAKACLEVTAPLVYGDNVSYVWQNLDGTLATGVDNPYALTSSAMIFQNTTLRLIATGGSGCNSDTATVVIKVNDKDVPVAIDEAESPVVSVFPNPAKDYVNVSANAIQRVEIYTIEGKLVYEQAGNGANTLTIPASVLGNGVFGIKVTTPSGIAVDKFVVNQ